MVEIRQAVDSDLERIYQLDRMVPTDVARKQFFRTSISQKGCWVAVQNGEIVGVSILEYWFYGCGFISLVLVRDDHRRQGIGSRLMQQTEAGCKTAKLFSSTNLSNLPMQNLFPQLGFVQSGCIENLDEGDPELIYFKRLRP